MFLRAGQGVERPHPLLATRGSREVGSMKEVGPSWLHLLHLPSLPQLQTPDQESRGEVRRGGGVTWQWWSIHSWMSKFTDGTSLCSCRGSASDGALVRVGPNTRARLADVILFSVLCRDTLCKGERESLRERDSCGITCRGTGRGTA